MSVRLTKGTKQYINVIVKDTTGVVDDLTVAGATTFRFDVKRISDDASIVTNGTALNSGMILQCLVDTSGYNAEPHALYGKFTLGSEIVVLGPFTFYIME